MCCRALSRLFGLFCPGRSVFVSRAVPRCCVTSLQAGAASHWHMRLRGDRSERSLPPNLSPTGLLGRTPGAVGWGENQARAPSYFLAASNCARAAQHWVNRAPGKEVSLCSLAASYSGWRAFLTPLVKDTSELRRLLGESVRLAEKTGIAEEVGKDQAGPQKRRPATAPAARNEPYGR